MGGLFSSTERPAPPSQPPRRYSVRAEPPRPPVRNYYNGDELRRLETNLESLTIRDYYSNIGRTSSANDTYAGGRRSSYRKITAPVRVVTDPNKCNLVSDPYFDYSSVVSYIELATYDWEYMEIRRMITNKKNFKVHSIERIENPFLKKAYELKKEQKNTIYPNVEERLLFHGTKRANVDTICKLNFDWRLCKAHKYGKGVSFSPNSTYASVYSDENVYNKIMIVAKVLIAASCIGNQFMELPLEGCDTSQKGDDGIVIVKFEDNEFYPAYKINYHLVDETVGKRMPGRRNNRRRMIY